MRRQATPELNLKDSAARSLIDSCPERKRVHLPAAVGDGIRGNPTRITAILTDQWALHDPVVLARCLGRPRSRRRGHPPSRILRRPAGLDASVGAGTHCAVRSRAGLPPRRRRPVGRRDPPPANGTPPACTGMLRRRWAGTRRNRLGACLRDQLGVSPSPATRQLYQRLLAAT